MKTTTFMKRSFVSLVSIACMVIIFVSLYSKENDSKEEFVQPTDVSTEVDKEGNKQERRAYLESLHRAADGVDWKEMDNQTRRNKASKLLNQSRSVQALANSYANGAVFGDWSEKGSNNIAGRIRRTFYDTNNQSFYAASEGGVVWKSNINGTNWEPLNDEISMDRPILITRVANGPGYRIILISGEFNNIRSIYSDDEGATWQSSTGLDQINNQGHEAVIANDANKTIYVLSGNAGVISASSDKGATFNVINGDATFLSGRYSLWTEPKGSGIVYLMIGDICYTINSSGTLTQVGTIPNITLQTFTTVNLVGREYNGQTYLYAGFRDTFGFDSSHPTTIYRSVDGGVTWTQQGVCPQGVFDDKSLECSLANPNHVFLGGIDGYYSLDAGVTWSLTNRWFDYYNGITNNLHADIPEIRSFLDENNNEFLAISTDGGLYVSTNSMQNVTNISLAGLKTSQYYDVYTATSDETTICAGAQDQGHQLSTIENNGIRDFIQVTSGDAAQVATVNGGQTMWQTNQASMIYFKDPINSTSYLSSSYSSISGKEFIPPIMVEPNDPNIVYVGGGTKTGTGDHIFSITYSEQFDFLGAPSQLPFDFGSNIIAMEYSPVNTNYRYVITDQGQFYRSIDAGSNWVPAYNFPNTLRATQILPSKTVAGEVLVSGSGYSNAPVFKSTDNGTSFTSMSNGLPNTLVHDIDFNEDQSMIFGATAVGPYVYIVADDMWYDLSEGNAPDQDYTSVQFLSQSKIARFGTYGRGIWDFTVGNQTQIAVQSVALSETMKTLNLGDSFTLTETVLPTDATNKAVSWSSTNSSIASVTNGVVTANAIGTATITVTTVDGSKTATCSVTVTGNNNAVLVIEAENFDSTDGTIDDSVWGGPGNGVGVSSVGINWVNGGDSAVYDINVAESGVYKIEYEISSPNNNANINFYLGTTLISSDAVVNNGQWDAYQTLEASNTVELTSGTHTITIEGTGNAWQWNLDKIVLTKVSDIAVPIIPPVVAFTTPVDGAVFSTTSTVDISVLATASDADGTVADVTLYLNNQLVRVDSTFPYEWNFGTQNDVQLDGLGAGNYTLRAVAVDNEGNLGEIISAFTVDVTTTVVDPITIEAETFTGTTGTFNDGFVPLGVNNSGIGINWVNSGDEASYSFNVVSAGEYEIEYFISSPANNAQIQLLIDGNIISTDNVTNNGQWDDYYSLVAGNTVNLSSGSHTAKVVASGSNVWQWNLDKIVLTKVTVLPEDISVIKSVEVYPNPVIDYLTVSVDGSLSNNAFVQVVNGFGIVVIQESLISLNQQISTGHLNTGVYVLNVINGGDVKTTKFIKQ